MNPLFPGMGLTFRISVHWCTGLQKALEKEAAAKKVSSKGVVDIDIAAEEKAAKDAADIAYWEAVQDLRREE